MEDVPELVDSLREEGGFLDSISGELSEKDINTKFDEFLKNNPSFDSEFRIETDEKGNTFFQKENQKISIDEIKSDMTKGDYTSALRKLNVDISDPQVKSFLENEKFEVENSPGQRDIRDVESTKNESFKEDPKSAEDFKNNITEEERNTFEEFKEKVKEEGKRKKFGKWVKRTIFLGLAGFGIFEFYSMVQDHKKDMNGCWMVGNDGTKCKIYSLSCSDTNNNQLCRKCIDSRICSGKFNPCLKNGKPKNKNITFPGKNCSNCTKCSRRESCKSCSSFCNSKNIRLSVGYSIVCVNVGFWGAASDLVEKPRGIIGKLEKVVKYLVIIGICILVLVLIYKVISWIKDKN